MFGFQDGSNVIFIIFKMTIILKDMNLFNYGGAFADGLNIYQTSSFLATFVVFVCWDVHLQLK